MGTDVFVVVGEVVGELCGWGGRTEENAGLVRLCWNISLIEDVALCFFGLGLLWCCLGDR
jgi:hypothetical protein